MVEDKKMVCSDCGEEFFFTVQEQEFYREKGFSNEPKRCKPCRQKKKSQRPSFGRGGSRELFTATCADCGQSTEVPFKPKENRPVYCRECYQSRKK